jgi:rubrerythrin
MEKWKCKKCNYIFVGDEAPRICPNCGHKAEFELFFEMDSGPFIPLYDE